MGTEDHFQKQKVRTWPDGYYIIYHEPSKDNKDRNKAKSRGRHTDYCDYTQCFAWGSVC